ncbi:MAG: SAM-dependent chlorinase/fluorinase [Candidatus Kaelpia imicola]|nr:SAM-dependent chlorinase/fluorinase [Candidatus Kaelpia imicola]
MIALLTDFGFKDEYAGVIKGVICSINPRVKIIDLCHEIPAQDILWAALLIYKSCSFFPAKTIFLCIVDPAVGSKRDIVIVKKDSRYFIAPDNGLLSFIVGETRGLEIIKVNPDEIQLQPLSSTFHGRDIFAPLAAHLSIDNNISRFGAAVESIKLIEFPQPEITDGKIIAMVIQIDRFGNLTTNLERDVFEKLGWKNLEIQLRDSIIREISNCYEKKRDSIAIWGSRGLLEIAVPDNSAADILGLNRGSIVIIKRK